MSVAGITFILVVAPVSHFCQESWLPPATRLIRWSALALALAQFFFIISNTFILTSSADLSVGQALGANYVIAGVLGIAAGLVVFFWPSDRRDRASPLFIIPAVAMIISSVMTSHSASRIEDRPVLVVFTII